MKNPFFALAGLFLIALAALWFWNRSPSPAASGKPTTSVRESPQLPAPAHPILEPDLPPELTAASGSELLPDPVSRPTTEAARIDSQPLVESYPPGMPPPRRVSDVIPEAAPDFDKISIMFRNFRTLTGENPTGTNAEIMAAILGGNPKGAKLGPPEGQELNADGELIDRWGSPYFFHQLGKDRMEIRSAGPDKRMWNEDDIIGD
jgi:hypothetical protein